MIKCNSCVKLFRILRQISSFELCIAIAHYTVRRVAYCDHMTLIVAETLIKELGHENRVLDYLKVDTDKNDQTGFEDVVSNYIYICPVYILVSSVFCK